MLADISNYKHSELTNKIIKCFYIVYNELGYGFLEKVYENALMHELSKKNLVAEKQKQINVFYDGIKIGEYYADLFVDEKVIVEIKAVDFLAEEHEFQLINYLKATNIEVGLLLNFGKEPGIKRKVYSNELKNHISS
jgi:GxxExxY protein